LKGHCFSYDEEVTSAVRKWFQKQTTNFFKDGFQKLAQHLQKCTEVRSDFVKKHYAALKIIDVGIFLFLFH